MQPQTEAVLDSLKKEFLKAEANQPAEGYSYIFHTTKQKASYQAELKRWGKDL